MTTFSFFSPLLGHDSCRRFVALVMGAGESECGVCEAVFLLSFSLVAGRYLSVFVRWGRIRGILGIRGRMVTWLCII